MTAYLDTSVVVSLFLQDQHTSLADQWLDTRPRITLSPWTATEFTSALSLAQRLGRVTAVERSILETKFDAWLASLSSVVAVEFEDFTTARELMLRHPLLRAGDALHLAVAHREALVLATFDQRLADAAHADGVALAAFTH